MWVARKMAWARCEVKGESKEYSDMVFHTALLPAFFNGSAQNAQDDSGVCLPRSQRRDLGADFTLGVYLLSQPIGAAVLAAGFAALAMAASLTVHRFGRDGRGAREGGKSEDGGERKNSNGAFHGNLLDVLVNGTCL
jgi:hypothetical protein